MGEGAYPEGLRRWLVLTVVIVGTFMAVLDVTIVNVVLPKIMSAFGANVKQVQWVSTAFMIATAVSMPATGWLGRRFGLGRLYLAELLVFSIGSALCTVAWSLDALVAARVVQALGAGAIMPTSMAIITDTFPPRERGRALGIWGVGFMVGPAIGPTLGGYLTDWFNWRAVFAVNLPVGLVAMLLTALVLRENRPDRSSNFDWKGFLTLGVFLVVGLLTLDSGQEQGWNSQIILLGMASTALALVLFVLMVWDSPHPVMPLHLFRSTEYSMTMLLSTLRACGFFGALFLLPIFLQTVQGRDTIDTGLLLVPGAVTVAIFMPVAGILTDRIGPRWPTVFGVLLMVYSLYLYHSLDVVVSRWDVIYPQIWRGVAVTFLMTPVNTAAMNAVPREEAGNASWMINLTMTVGGAFTIALMGSLLYRETLTQMDLLGEGTFRRALPPELIHQARGLGFSSSESGALARALMVRHVSRSATVLAFQYLFMLLGLITSLGLLPALFLSKRGKAAKPAQEG
ncbi:MAG: DHA2 family efflux MFS transporter permease subunit [SAR324 cluster bacterium]|nr:DHA2 family efflux MFS transporter permease subunit [SAR324 cluster bacterium]